MVRATLVFDPKARLDYITGFHRRKMERRQKARQKLAEEVRQDKLQVRREKRDQTKHLHGIGDVGKEAVGSAAGSSGGGVGSSGGVGSKGSVQGCAVRPAPSAASVKAAAAAKAAEREAEGERATYEFDGMVSTTVVSSLEPEPEPDRAARPSRPVGQRGLSAPQPKKKMFRLDVPLTSAIPGYKGGPQKMNGPKKSKKKKEGGRPRGAVSKKEKAKNRSAGHRKN